MQAASIPGGVYRGVSITDIVPYTSKSWSGCNAPMAVESPCAFLAFLTAVFGTPATAALRKLPCVLFPFAALVVGTLTDASPGVVLSAQVSHNHTGPVLHVCAVVPDCELLHEGEYVLVVGEEVFLFALIFFCLQFGLQLGGISAVQKLDLLANLEFGDKVAFLEVLAKIAIL